MICSGNRADQVWKGGLGCNAAHAELVVTQSSIGRGLARKKAECNCAHLAHFDDPLNI